MKHKLFLLVAIFLIAVLCAGCGDPQSSVSSTDTVEIPEHLTVQLEENLTIDADISFDAAASYNTYRAEVLHFDVDAISALPINDPITEENRWDYEDGAFNYNASTASGGIIGLGSSAKSQNLRYQSGWVQDILSIVHIFPKDSITNWADYDSRSILPQGIDLSFASIEEVLADTTAALESLGIDLDENAEIYSLTVETLQTLADAYNDSQKERGFEDFAKTTWSSDDECYYMIFHLEHNGIPISSTNTAGTLLATSVSVCYNKDGLQFLQIDQPYSVLDVSEESGSIISMEELQEAIQEKYSTVILTDPVTITAIEFCYRPIIQSDNEYLLEPTWQVEIENTVHWDIGNDAVMYSYAGFNAVTGREQ